MIDSAKFLKRLPMQIGPDLKYLFPQHLNKKLYKGGKEIIPLFRYDYSGQRFYYHLDDKGELKFYNNVTNITSKISKGVGYDKYLAGYKTYEAAVAFAVERAWYGTLLHNMCAHFAIHGSLTDGDAILMMHEFCQVNGIDPYFIFTCKDELLWDLKAFETFCFDKRVQFIGVEVPVIHDKDGYATYIDFILKVYYKNDFHDVIMDVKSGKKGFYDSHELQLHLQLRAWNRQNLKHKIKYVFNWRPTPLGASDMYVFQNQTSSKFAKSKLVESYVHIANANKIDPYTTTISVIDKLKLDLDNYDPNQVKRLTIAEFCKLRITAAKAEARLAAEEKRKRYQKL